MTDIVYGDLEHGEDDFDYQGHIELFMEQINEHIDENKKIVSQTHSFSEKILAMLDLFLHLDMQYEEYSELHDFFNDISDVIYQLSAHMEKIRRGEIHIVAEG